MRYPIGTRIRVVSAERHLEMLNAEGTITGYHPITDDAYLIDVPGFIAGIGLYRGSSIFGALHDQIEPITYDGNKVTEWSEEDVWRPETQRVSHRIK